MDEEIKVNSLVVLALKEFHNHCLYNKLLVVIDDTGNNLTVIDINNNYPAHTFYSAGTLKLFNPNEYNFKYKNIIFTDKVISVETIIDNYTNYLIKFETGEQLNLKDITLIKKETKLMRYKVKTKLIVNFPENTIIEKHQTSNVYKSNNDPCTWLTADLVENNPGFFQKIEFTEENIIKLRHKLNNLDARFHAFGTSEGFIKEFKEFEKIVKEMGEFL